jgi:hypothetical protein
LRVLRFFAAKKTDLQITLTAPRRFDALTLLENVIALAAKKRKGRKKNPILRTKTSDTRLAHFPLLI